MLRRFTVVLLLAGLVQGYRPSPGTGCESMTPMSSAMLLPTGVTLPGACGQAMSQCPTGPCAALPQALAHFAISSNAPIPIEFIAHFHNRAPPPPEPPPPQA